jgi:hypothetical protein
LDIVVESSGQTQSAESSVEAGATSLNGLNFCLSVGKAVEASGELGAVEKLALLGLNRSKGSSRGAANGALGEGCTAKGTVLLCLGPVGREGVRKDTGGRGRVRTGSVVNRFYREN